MREFCPTPNSPTLCQELPVIDESYHKYGHDLRRMSLLIHGFREIPFQEHESSSLLCDFLEQQGFNVERGIAGDRTAFVGTFSQGKGPIVSFNAV